MGLRGGFGAIEIPLRCWCVWRRVELVCLSLVCCVCPCPCPCPLSLSVCLTSRPRKTTGELCHDKLRRLFVILPRRLPAFGRGSLKLQHCTLTLPWKMPTFGFASPWQRFFSSQSRWCGRLLRLCPGPLKEHRVEGAGGCWRGFDSRENFATRRSFR